MERTLVILKPDCVDRGLIGKVTGRFEEKGLKINAMKMAQLTKEMLAEHYVHHKNKPFYSGLVQFMSSKPCIIMVLEGADAVKVVRKITGATSGREAEAGTIRGDFSSSTQANIIHASDSAETAELEIKRFFKKDEIFSYEKSCKKYLYTEEGA